MSFVRVKICCISSSEEAQLAIKYGASALGLVSEMPGGPGVISLEKISEIVSTIPPSISTVLLTSRQDASDIIDQLGITKAGTLQVCNTISRPEYFKIKEMLPWIKIILVVHVNGEHSINEALEYSKYADALLLDSGNLNKVVKELGGTGRVHDWEISRRICNNVDIPVWLAGGLTPGNIPEALDIVSPFGVDVCSGLRRNGSLDEKQLSLFMRSVLQFNNK